MTLKRKLLVLGVLLAVAVLLAFWPSRKSILVPETFSLIPRAPAPPAFSAPAGNSSSGSAQDSSAPAWTGTPANTNANADVNPLMEDALKVLSDPRGRPPTNTAEVVDSLRPQDMQKLKDQTLSLDVPGDRRSAALYLLTQAGAKAAQPLSEIAGTNLPASATGKDPHSAGMIQRTFEVSLRIRALEALDTAATQDRGMEKYLVQVLDHQQDPTLRFLTQVSETGIQQGRPGKLRRVIDEALKETGRKSPAR